MSLEEDDKRLFSHPSEFTLQSGLSCEDAECVGHYVKKLRDLTFKRNGGTITIKNSEYWECDVCGSFVTSKEEMKRIRVNTREQIAYTGRLTLRLSPELHQQLAEEAQSNHRSLNNELAYRLAQSLKSEERT
jgi:YgiT-type zinc finger domain-containing protein